MKLLEWLISADSEITCMQSFLNFQNLKNLKKCYCHSVGVFTAYTLAERLKHSEFTGNFQFKSDRHSGEPKAAAHSFSLENLI